MNDLVPDTGPDDADLRAVIGMRLAFEAEVPEVLANLASPQATDLELRDALRGLPPARLVASLGHPRLARALPRLVPLLKVSDLVPCLRAPGLAERLVPHLDPAQCKQVGPELASAITPAIAACWAQLEHLPLETVVRIPTATFAQLPVAVLARLPTAHRHYLMLHVAAVRPTASREDHDLALGTALRQILLLYSHKVLDPEHLPSLSELRALSRSAALGPRLQALRWLVDAVMTDEVKAVQVGALKLSTVTIELRRAGLTDLALELDRAFRFRRELRGLSYGADGIAYTDEHALAVRHRHVAASSVFGASRSPREGDPLAPLAAALRDAVDQHASVGPAGRQGHPLPTERYRSVIALALEDPRPRHTATAWQQLEAVLDQQLGAPRHGVLIHEVHITWAEGSTTRLRRQRDGRYR
jgi:hypothetical protein